MDVRAHDQHSSSRYRGGTVRQRRCACGCGALIPAVNKNGQPARYKHGHNRRKHPGPTDSSGRRLGTTRCYECREKFQRRVDQIRWHGLREFCSKECYGVYSSRISKGRILLSTRTGKTIRCATCAKEFYVSGSKLSETRFCSRACYAAWLRDHGKPGLIKGAGDRTGKNNPNYRHGQRVGEKHRKDLLRGQLLERSGGVCEMPGCSSTRLFHKHRITYGSQGGQYVLENTALLCRNCHETVHSDKPRWQPALFDVVPGAREYAQEVRERIAAAAGRTIASFEQRRREG